jgi:hypothetical protein
MRINAWLDTFARDSNPNDKEAIEAIEVIPKVSYESRIMA